MKQPIMEQIVEKLDAVQRHMDGKEIYAIDLKKRCVYGMHLVTMRDLKNDELIYFELKQEPKEKVISPKKPEE